jgi:hypothetical protein
MHNERRRGQRPRRHDQLPALHNERRRGQRPGERAPRLSTFAASQASALAPRSSTCNAERAAPQATAVYFDQRPKRRRRHRPWHHNQVPATHNKRRREQQPGHHDQLIREPKQGRVQQLGQGPRTRKLGTNSDETPCNDSAFVVNSEPHTRARPSIRLCMGPELSRCVHSIISPIVSPCARGRRHRKLGRY